MIIVRYADDIIVGFEYQTDARRFWEAIRERLEEYSLSLRPDKTRLIEFGRFAADQRARRGLKEEMRRRRHQPISEQGKWLRQVVAGFFEYHAVPTNSRALNRFRHHVTDLWRRSLQRRSQKDRITWHRIKKLADDFLPQARVLHSWPLARFAVKHPRWEPSALIGHAGICAGGA